MATPIYTTVPLSSLIRDPDVRAAFWRAERDDGDQFAVTVKVPVLSGGEGVK